MIKALLRSSGWPQTPESDLPPKWGDHRPAPFVHLFILGVKILAPSLQSPAWREVKWAVCVLQGMACYFRTFWLTARAKSATNNSCFPDSGGWMRDCANRKEGQISLLEKHTCLVWPSPGVSGLVLFLGHPVCFSCLLHLKLAHVCGLSLESLMSSKRNVSGVSQVNKPVTVVLKDKYTLIFTYFFILRLFLLCSPA